MPGCAVQSRAMVGPWHHPDPVGTAAPHLQGLRTHVGSCASTRGWAALRGGEVFGGTAPADGVSVPLPRGDSTSGAPPQPRQNTSVGDTRHCRARDHPPWRQHPTDRLSPRHRDGDQETLCRRYRGGLGPGWGGGVGGGWWHRLSSHPLARSGCHVPTGVWHVSWQLQRGEPAQEEVPWNERPIPAGGLQ